jgi:hydrogenase maturation protease
MSKFRSNAVYPPKPHILVIGYGNPGRQDDGLGPAAALHLATLRWPHLTAFDTYQLNIEDAMDVAEHDIIWFVDASKTGDQPFSVREVAPASAIEFTSHILRPEALLAIARDFYGKTPKGFMLAIRGYEFEFIEDLTLGAIDNLHAALTMLSVAILDAHIEVAS